MRGHAAGRNPAEPNSTLGRLSSCMAPSSSGQDTGFSIRERGFDSLRGHQHVAFVQRPRTLAFQAGNAGSSPARDTSFHQRVAQAAKSTGLGHRRPRVRIPPR